MKILFVITGLGVGGAERQVVDLAGRLAKLGHSLKIAYMTGPVLLSPENSSIEVVSLGVNKSFMGFIGGLRNLLGLLRGFEPDIVHSHMVHANILARIAKIFYGHGKLVCTAHNTNEGGWLRMLAYRLTDSLADVSTNVSEEAVFSFVKKRAVPPGRMIPVLNGIDVEFFNFNQESRREIRERHRFQGNKLFVAVGRMFEAKDYPNLLKAFSLVVRERPGVRLWIVGDGPLRESLNDMVYNLKLANFVVFLGVRHDIPKILSAADVFVLSSAWEGFGLVVAEAMAVQRIVVATNSGGVAEVVGEAGFLVPPSNPQALAESLIKAASLSDADAGALGVKARKRVLEKYSLDSVVERWLCIYKDPKGALLNVGVSGGMYEEK